MRRVRSRHGPSSFAPRAEFVCATGRVRLRHGASSFAPRAEFVWAAARVRLGHGPSSFPPGVEFVWAAARVRLRQGSSSFGPGVEFVRAAARVRLYRSASSFAPGIEFVRAAARVRLYRSASSFAPPVKLVGSARSAGSRDSCELPRSAQDAPALSARPPFDNIVKRSGIVVGFHVGSGEMQVLIVTTGAVGKVDALLTDATTARAMDRDEVDPTCIVPAIWKKRDGGAVSRRDRPAGNDPHGTGPR